MEVIPEDCPKELIAIMVKCWGENPKMRPDFADVVRALRGVSITS
jgi:hypothetical protein